MISQQSIDDIKRASVMLKEQASSQQPLKVTAEILLQHNENLPAIPLSALPAG
jgi:hypothetical protein